MGVPALFRWLSLNYPKIIVPVVEEDVNCPDGKAPIDNAEANPNGKEFDNLYLDMNGIIHNCTHPEGRPAPETEDLMMVEIFGYAERIVNIVRPRKLLFLAIDGVAPRAKMNEQRRRRFKKAKEEDEARKEADAIYGSPGHHAREEVRQGWDSNAITPGTPFMAFLAKSLRYWIVMKLNSDPRWRNLKVILSDSSVPGEGEHKILDYIRTQRVQYDHDPNTFHVFYGSDADLIMLSLATHEPYFRIIREDMFVQDRDNACRRCGEEGHYATQCSVTLIPKSRSSPTENAIATKRKPFTFIDITILREYLKVDLEVPRPPPHQRNPERAIDDWVFLIFLVGNDFLPHLPSLKIHEGAIGVLMSIWKDALPKMGGYLTENGHLDLAKTQIILQRLSEREPMIFRKRHEAEVRQHEKRKLRLEEAAALTVSEPGNASRQHILKMDALKPLNREGGVSELAPGPSAAPASCSPFSKAVIAGDGEVFGLNAVHEMFPSLSISSNRSGGGGGGRVALETATGPSALSASFGHSTFPELSSTNYKHALDGPELYLETNVAVSTGIRDGDEQHNEEKFIGIIHTDQALEVEDTVMLWEPGYRHRYYEQKFKGNVEDDDLRGCITEKYVEGLAWVLAYYYQGVPCWRWFYPYHYAPFAADFKRVAATKIDFKDDKLPLKPFEQLMGVLPPASRKHIPAPFHNLMLDANSPIIDFYPTSFEVDMNGKKMAWQGLPLLPFIEEKRLLDAMKPFSTKLTEEEMQRNVKGKNVLFISGDNPLYSSVEELYKKGKSNAVSGTVMRDPKYHKSGSIYRCPLTASKLFGLENPPKDIPSDRSISVHYFFPDQSKPHLSALLMGVRHPKHLLSEEDLEPIRKRNHSGKHVPRVSEEGLGYKHSTSMETSGIYRPPGLAGGRSRYPARPSEGSSFNFSSHNDRGYRGAFRTRDE